MVIRPIDSAFFEPGPQEFASKTKWNACIACDRTIIFRQIVLLVFFSGWLTCGRICTSLQAGEGEAVKKEMSLPDPDPPKELPKKSDAPKPSIIIIEDQKGFRKNVLQSSAPCLVDFHSARCRPCLMLEPIIDRIADKYNERVRFCKASLDLQELHPMMATYRIEAIPAVLIFWKGKLQQRIIGLHQEDEYTQELDKILASSSGEKANDSKIADRENQATKTDSKENREPETEDRPEDLQPISIKDETGFEQHVLKASLPCLIDFYSVRCNPCKLLSPTIAALAKDYKGRVTICKVSLDLPENYRLAERYGIAAIPAVLFFQNGKEVQRLIGLRPKTEYAKALDKILESQELNHDPKRENNNAGL